MYNKDEPIDILTVANALKKKNELESVGGRVYIASLTESVAGAHNIEYHAKIVAQKYLQRELIRVATDIQKKAFNSSNDVSELLNYSERELFNISEGYKKKFCLLISYLTRH